MFQKYILFLLKVGMEAYSLIIYKKSNIVFEINKIANRIGYSDVVMCLSVDPSVLRGL